jgi:hypothetical protein
MTTRTFSTTLDLALLDGASGHVELDVWFEHTPASGDGFHEEHHPQSAELLRVTAYNPDFSGEVDLLPLFGKRIKESLSKMALESLEETV